MRIDGHVHIRPGPAEPGKLLEGLRAAGMAGGIIISPPPSMWSEGQLMQASMAERLDSLRAWTAGYPTLFPFYWIDPTASDALRQVDQAVAAGVAGFKVICSEHAPGDPRAIPVYHAIAGHNKPVLFHSGILWDGLASSNFNRPAAFEALLDVPKLRFSLAHISWPWVDECVAVYGKFLNATTRRPSAPEMLIDLTPGTPPIYREDALTKLFTVGYDVGDNLIFGTDAEVGTYTVDWSRTWQERDLAIMRKLGLGADAIEKVFGGNLQRWLSGASAHRRAPIPGQ